ncbi:MAG: hypothetical protein AAFU79_34320 [Myxococcota bacterium]
MFFVVFGSVFSLTLGVLLSLYALVLRFLEVRARQQRRLRPRIVSAATAAPCVIYAATVLAAEQDHIPSALDDAMPMRSC